MMRRRQCIVVGDAKGNIEHVSTVATEKPIGLAHWLAAVQHKSNQHSLIDHIIVGQKLRLQHINYKSNVQAFVDGNNNKVPPPNRNKLMCGHLIP